jgi:hypothetical protein
VPPNFNIFISGTIVLMDRFYEGPKFYKFNQMWLII